MNKTRVFARQERWEADPDIAIRSVSGPISAAPSLTATSTMQPYNGFFGVEKGVGGRYHFGLYEGHDLVGRFTVFIHVPACGDGRFELQWKERAAGIGAVVRHLGKGGCNNAHRHQVTLGLDLKDSLAHNMADSALRGFERFPVAGLAISAGHAAAGSKGQAKRAAVADGASTVGLLAAAATGGLAAPAIGAAAAGAVGGITSAVASEAAERSFNELQGSAHALTDQGGWESFDVQRFAVSAGVGAVAGAAGATKKAAVLKGTGTAASLLAHQAAKRPS